MVHILHLCIRDDYALSPMGRPDISTECNDVIIHTDLPIECHKNIPVKKEWSQTMTYIIFPDGLCLNLVESNKLSHIFYLEDVPSYNEEAIKFFIEDASRYCDSVELTTIDPQKIIQLLPQWRSEFHDQDFLNKVEKEACDLIGKIETDPKDLLQKYSKLP